MSILNTTNPTNFLLHIPDSQLTEATQMHVQVYKPPTIEIPGVDIPSGPFGKSRSFVPGTAFIYKPITMSILVDRELRTWLEMFQWASAIVDYKKYTNETFESISESNIQLHILNNTKTETVVIHEFTQAFPSLIYPPTYNHTAGSDYPMVMNVEFKYHTLNVLNSNGDEIRPRLPLAEARYQQYKDNTFSYQKKKDDNILK